MTTPSKRAQNTPTSPIRKLMPLSLEAQKQGKNVLRLNIGQPDVSSPSEFFDGVRNYPDEVVRYQVSEGTQELRAAWASYIEQTLSIQLHPERFLIGQGASEALFFAFLCCCDYGDEILVADPTYANYLGIAGLSDIKLVPVLSSFENGFAPAGKNTLEKRKTSRTKALLVCSPSNPTGTVCTREHLKEYLDFCEEHDLFLIVDETYREIVYDGRAPLSVLHIDRDNPRVIVIDSLSKRFSLCGARIGLFYTANEELYMSALRMAQARLSAASVEQYAAVHLFQHGSPDSVERLRQEFEERRNVLCEGLDAISGVEYVKPEGAFYCFARLPVKDSEDFAKFLLKDFNRNGKTIFIAPGAGFYVTAGEGHDQIRIGFVLQQDLLREAVEILGEGLEAYQKK